MVNKFWNSVTFLNFCSAERICGAHLRMIFLKLNSIKNVIDESPIHREMLCYYSSTCEGKLLQKALKGWAQKNQWSSRPFFVAAGKFTGFQSPESILDHGQWNRTVLKDGHKFLVNGSIPVSFEKEIFHHHSLFDSIHPNLDNVYLKCWSKNVLSARPYGQIFSLNIYDWFRNWFRFEVVSRIWTIPSPKKDKW
jgi:hypothetical protein